MAQHEREVILGGVKHTVLLDEDEAKRYDDALAVAERDGAVFTDPEAKPLDVSEGDADTETENHEVDTKARRTVANKARTARGK